VLAKAKRLRDRARAAYQAGKIGEAMQDRHAALIAIGYKMDDGAGAADGVPLSRR
jgi:hypothetical protein